jgi:hypothetical protein
MEAANFDDERSRLCDLASSGARVFFTAHAVEEMLCTCTVTRVADSKGEESWRAEGEDFDGRVIVAVVVPYESANPPYIKIVTAWVKK